MKPNREICGKQGRSVPSWVCGLPPGHVGPCALYDTEEASA